MNDNESWLLFDHEWISGFYSSYLIFVFQSLVVDGVLEQLVINEMASEPKPVSLVQMFIQEYLAPKLKVVTLNIATKLACFRTVT